MPPPGPPPGQIPGQPQVGGYGAPVPPQHNPYAQTAAGPYGSPQPAYYGAPQPPGAAPAGAPRGGAGKAVLWGVVGAVVASALWGGGMLLLGKDSGKPALHGYKVSKNLCSALDMSAFTTAYPKPDDDPTFYTSDRPTLAEMHCSESLKQESSTYSDAYLTVDADLHRKTDPQAEFADHMKGYEVIGGADAKDKYTVTPVEGFGDEAYLATMDSITAESDGSSTGSREAVLSVRDGALIFTMSWYHYPDSLNDNQDEDKSPTLSQGTEWVKASTKATLAKLK
ncbi:hypothetical protein NMG29_07535 [Streptomyces cocklensis]|uniref:Uncharacterized protein n=1 Tax=Actinacidiphila cocklensis TaxID=887465 RepID=A0A9W4DNC2_9ACTN|nr:hypothetical protein [Actinacidiphila cocklensis]MDD1058080.1 hypothetical protein [Actinacidiphila cocklensis]CAG6393109.1 conserved hypothetical protein [Actinacidiphila cocklensis]